MSRLKGALQREHGTSLKLHSPKNTHAVRLLFRGQKTAKVVGKLAVEGPKQNMTLSGLIVKRNFNYHVLGTDDLNGLCII